MQGKMNITEEVRKFVENECKKPESKYGNEPYLCHFLPVASYSKILAKKFGADEEIVEIVAWLHDIGSIVYGRENHHITSAEIAEKKLRELGYPEEKIKIVKKCILNHRGSVNNKRESKEEQIIADADSMSNFENVSGIFKAAFVYENLGQIEAKHETRKKLENCYNKLSEEAKKIIKPKYEAAMLLLE
ncbi:HD domain-containing protein [Candidatus Pacearchaeota archaeon]|nr:HD domain-containing protein [Candidatus Pacearchaeota archaeon]